MPIINAQNAYNALKGLVKAMGLINVDDYSSDPKVNESVIQLVQAIITHLNKMDMYGQQLNAMPQVQAMINELSAPLQRVMANFGMGGDTKDENREDGMNTNQNRPRQAETAAQPMNPTLSKDGKDYFG